MGVMEPIGATGGKNVWISKMYIESAGLLQCICVAVCSGSVDIVWLRIFSQCLNQCCCCCFYYLDAFRLIVKKHRECVCVCVTRFCWAARHAQLFISSFSSHFIVFIVIKRLVSPQTVHRSPFPLGSISQNQKINGTQTNVWRVNRCVALVFASHHAVNNESTVQRTRRSHWLWTPFNVPPQVYNILFVVNVHWISSVSSAYTVSGLAFQSVVCSLYSN